MPRKPRQHVMMLHVNATEVWPEEVDGERLLVIPINVKNWSVAVNAASASQLIDALRNAFPAAPSPEVPNG